MRDMANNATEEAERRTERLAERYEKPNWGQVSNEFVSGAVWALEADENTVRAVAWAGALSVEGALDVLAALQEHKIGTIGKDADE